MRTAIGIALMTALCACGIKGDLKRPSEAAQEKQKTEKTDDGFFQLPR